MYAFNLQFAKHGIDLINKPFFLLSSIFPRVRNEHYGGIQGLSTWRPADKRGRVAIPKKEEYLKDMEATCNQDCILMGDLRLQWIFGCECEGSGADGVSNGAANGVNGEWWRT